MSTQFQLMTEQRFRPFFFTQFLGAFNDNVFKTSLITLVAFHAVSLTTIDGGTLATVLPGLFILPFFLFSATAGQLADKFEKSQIIRYVKVFEIGIMLFASAGFFLHNIGLLAAALFMMGMHSTIFGPVKYSYLPQHLKETELIGGNGMVEMGSFVAILLGQVLGAWLAIQSSHEIITSIAIIAIAALGYWTSRGVPNSPAAAPNLKINWNPITETYRNVKFIWQHQTIWLAIVAISWFWFYGATLLAQFPNFAKNVLYGDESLFILLLSIFSLGIGIGSLMCEKLSKGKVEVGLVVFGAIGLTLFGIDLYWSGISVHESLNNKYLLDYMDFVSLHHDMHGNIIFTYWRLLADIALIGFFGGLYIVPLYALIQTRSEKSHQSRIIAANNIFNALFMVISAAFSIWMFKQGYNIPELFLTTAILNALVIIYLCIRQPEYLKTFVAWMKP
ncbi:MAG: MFS transporter [Methylotenera sp.]|uniref:MFS transporter n=1 Tax=Methylotenera sp. TaxID=2051956 RepID=UPI002723509C|nr:MFS transporter [Methylotenera sp.]MDO9394872.1 MFS transporter [Methylotenera sp.]MDP1523577.1 MFS transporter [Methylotenera sp.]